MVVVVFLVVFVLPPKHVPMEFVLELPLLIVLDDNAETTELEEAVVLALLDRDAEQDNASVIMIVMKETVVMLLNLMEPTPGCAHRDHAELAQVDSPANLMEDVLLLSNAPSQLQVLTVPPENLWQLLPRLPSHKEHMPQHLLCLLEDQLSGTLLQLEPSPSHLQLLDILSITKPSLSQLQQRALKSASILVKSKLTSEMLTPMCQLKLGRLLLTLASFQGVLDGTE